MIGLTLAALHAAGCKSDEAARTAPPKVEPAASKTVPSVNAETGIPKLPDSLPNGLLLAYSQFKIVDGEATADPGPARFDILRRENGKWKSEVLEDPQSNIFHKAMPLMLPDETPAVLTAAGTEAYVKLWRRGKDGKLHSTSLWHPSFGGKVNRIRDAEVGDLYGDGAPAIAVATHDQGVVAILRHKLGGRWSVEEIDRRENTFVHEVEIGDLDDDGVLEVYASPTPPNRYLTPGQSGDVVRYVPKTGEGPTVVAALGTRHAKELYVDDVDGDGIDELYVPVEAVMSKLGADAKIVEPMEIRRYDAGTPSSEGIVIARIPDRHARFLTAGDMDGDGKKELVVASFSQGLWLLSPGKDPKSEWGVENIDRDTGGFEHAALFADLDEDGTDELYVADDRAGELRRYGWSNDRVKREVVQKREHWRSRMTWNIVAIPLAPYYP